MEKYFRTPLDENLSKTSYRAIANTDYALYIEYNEGYIDPSWEEVTEEQLIDVFGFNPFTKESQPKPLPYQPTNAEVAQMISDLQADLIIAGVI